MSVSIIAGSTCDLSKAQQEALGIRVLPLTVLFGEEAYYDGVTITRREFYEKLRAAEELPHTSQVSPADFEAAFSEALARGDEVLCVTVSSSLSGTWQSAMIAKDMVSAPEKVHIVDSRAVTMAEALLLFQAVRLRDEGLCAADIAKELEALKPRIRIFAAIDTLKYLRMGGRLSGATAAIGGVLQLKPIITLDDDGLVTVASVCRGTKKAYRTIAEELKKQPPAALPHAVVLGNTDAPELMDELTAALLAEGVDVSAADRLDIGAVVGTHAGPGCVGAAWIAK